ncbi:MAG: hypothetical protein QOF38_3580 [Pseudonocardiales bacterium]|nr:hypothetical protein [Pseudonocardiales bacterium]
MSGPSSGAGASGASGPSGASGSAGALEGGRPGPCLVAGAVMLAVPTAIAFTALPGPESGGGQGTGLLLAVVLAVGALGVVLATARPRAGVMAALAVLCVTLALVLEPPEALGDGLCGLACLAFLLAVRLHRQARNGPVDLGAWLTAHRPMAIGAAVTTPAAIVAASVPAGWSLLVAALVGLLSAVICTVVFVT